MENTLDDILEVETGGKAKANHLLGFGWRLLNVAHVTNPEKLEGGPPFVRHGVIFVLGRPVDVPKQEIAVQVTDVADGWVQVDNAIVRSATLSVYEKAVYAVIKSHMNGAGAAWPGIRLIAEEANCSIPSVLSALRGLESAGLIHTDHRGNGRYSLYTITDQPQVTQTDQPQILQSYTVGPTDQREIPTDQPQIPTDQREIYQPINVADRKKTKEEDPLRRPIKKTKGVGRVLTISESFILEMVVIYKDRWGEQGTRDLIEEAVNYYLPEMRKGKYQTLAACVKGSLRRSLEREESSGQYRGTSGKTTTRPTANTNGRTGTADAPSPFAAYRDS